MALPLRGAAVAFTLSLLCGACSSSVAPATVEAGAAQEGGEGGDPADTDAPSWSFDAGATPTDGDAAPDGGYGERFVTGVVSFDPGPCAGFGASSMPRIVEGPPAGGGSDNGSIDVVSLGVGGSIVVSFGPSAIVDGPGPDFIVFENPFWVSGNPNDVFAEPGEVSVSDDGTTWETFPCVPTVDPAAPHGTGVEPPYGQCAGWHAVWSSPANGISPIDPAVAGGDAFDLADLGVTHARFVRIVDRTHEACPDAGPRPDDDGFDLDAVSIVNAELP